MDNDMRSCMGCGGQLASHEPPVVLFAWCLRCGAENYRRPRVDVDPLELVARFWRRAAVGGGSVPTDRPRPVASDRSLTNLRASAGAAA